MCAHWARIFSKGLGITESMVRFIEAKQLECRASTIARFRDGFTSLTKFLDQTQSHITRPAQITTATILDWRVWRLTETVARHKTTAPTHRTVNAELVAVRQWLGWLCLRNELRTNPADGVKRLRPGIGTEAKALSPQEWELIKRASLEIELRQPRRGPRNCRKGQTRLMRFLLCTGLRIGELIHLEWSDVQPDGIKIQEKKNWTPKTYARVVPLNQDAKQILDQIRQDSERGDGLVFVDYGGKPLRPGRVRTWIRDAAKRAGIDGVTGPHTMRHTCITWLANNPAIPPAHVQRMAGHTSLKTTQIYIHPSSSDLTESMMKHRVG